MGMWNRLVKNFDRKSGTRSNFSGVNAAAITDTTSTAVAAAPTTGTNPRYWITDIIVSNADDNVPTHVRILSGSTLKAVVFAGCTGPTTAASSASAGYHIKLNKPIQCGVSEAINAQPVTSGASIFVTVSGFITNDEEDANRDM